MSKRADHEKRTITKSLKMSPDDLKIIEERAEKKGMNFSRYMVESAVHRENGLTPEMLCRMENIIGQCVRIADKNDMDMLRMEADALWALLK